LISDEPEAAGASIDEISSRLACHCSANFCNCCSAFFSVIWESAKIARWAGASWCASFSLLDRDSIHSVNTM
jgi:hypothetical protein